MGRKGTNWGSRGGRIRTKYKEIDIRIDREENKLPDLDDKEQRLIHLMKNNNKNLKTSKGSR